MAENKVYNQIVQYLDHLTPAEKEAVLSKLIGEMRIERVSSVLNDLSFDDREYLLDNWN